MYCDTCNRETTALVKHHWRTSDEVWHDNYVCRSCNKLLIPSNFNMVGSHCLPDLETQRHFILIYNKSLHNRKDTYKTITIYKDDYDKLMARKRRGILITGLFHEMLIKTEPKKRSGI